MTTDQTIDWGRQLQRDHSRGGKMPQKMSYPPPPGHTPDVHIPLTST